MKGASICVGLMSYVHKIESNVRPQAGYKLSHNNKASFIISIYLFFIFFIFCKPCHCQIIWLLLILSVFELSEFSEIVNLVFSVDYSC